MKKIFIPTTSLNFNNIMSNASIAPAEFYAIRQFGYKRFVSIFTTVDAQKITIGFDKFPLYTLDSSEQQNFPLVIEHELEDYTDYEELAIDGEIKLYYIDQTLYLNPSNTKFHFFKQRHRDLTLITAKASLETKFVQLFESNIQVSDFRELESFNLQEMPDLKRKIETRKKISDQVYFDLMTEKFRGFTLGFTYGKVNIYDDKTINQLETLRTLNNEISSIKNIYFNYSKTDESNSRKLKSLGDNYDRVWERIDSIIEKCKLLEGYPIERNQKQNQSFAALLKETRLPNKSIEEINEFLRAFDITTLGGRSTVYQELEKMFRASQSRETYSVKEIPNILLRLFAPNKYRSIALPKEPFNYIERTISDLENSLMAVAFRSKGVMPEFRINYSNCSIQEMNIKSLSALENSTLIETLPKLMLFPITNMDEFMNNRLEIAMTFGKEFRDRIDSWDTSDEKRYFNDLLNHLQQHTQFDPNRTKSLFLKSLACTLMKGQEIEKLENFLITNKVGDFSIAFALWGSIYGLSKFPKNYFDRINPENQKVVFQNFQLPVEREKFVKESEESEPHNKLITILKALSVEMPNFKGWKESHTKSLMKIKDDVSDMVHITSPDIAFEEFKGLIDKKFTAQIRTQMAKRFEQIWQDIH